MEIEVFTGGPFLTNSYVLWFLEEREAVIVDPGFLAPVLLEALRRRDMRPRAVIVTHGHVDHVFGAMDFAGATLYFPEQDRFLVSGVWQNLRYPPPSGNLDLRGGDRLVLPDGQTCQVLATPGHSPGEVSLYLPEAGVLFSGDTLFAGSIGRTDLPGGDYDTLIRSIRRELLVLPEATRVLPGHGPETTLAVERDTNPFLF